MNVNTFISKTKELKNLKTVYYWGGFFNKKQSNSWCCDCSGLLKAIIWGYPYDGKYQSGGLKDHNANTIISNDCTDVLTDFSKIVAGEVVWIDGHIGIYIGNGKVIECTPKWNNGVQERKLSDRNWLKHGKLKCVDYSNSIAESEVCDMTLKESFTVIAKEVIKGTYGNGHATRANGIYDDVRKLVNGRTIAKTGDLLNALKTVANEVKKGTFKNGHEYRKKTIYELVRDRVNELI